MFALVFLCFTCVFFTYARSSKKSIFRLINTFCMVIAAILTALNLMAALYKNGYFENLNFAAINPPQWIIYSSLVLCTTIAAILNLKKIRDRG